MNNYNHDIISVLKLHAARYPSMLPQDVIKLLYQSNFGGGHLIKDADASLAYLHRELAGVEADLNAGLFEPCGGDVVRLNLAAAKGRGITPETINDVFVRSAELKSGSLAGFKALISPLRDNFASLGFGFDLPALDDYLRGYAAAGYPIVSHSDIYRIAYKPAYRVVLLPLCSDFL